MRRFSRMVYRRTLLVLMGVTKMISSTERSIPGKWHNVVDSVKVSSQVLHTRLTVVDEEVTEEFNDIEEGVKRSIGKGKLYTEKDIEQARRMLDEVDFRKAT